MKQIRKNKQLNNLKTLQKNESKVRILNVASRLFKKNGYTATGIDQVMHEAGLTAGGFYAHFKSKTDLLEQVVEHSLKHSYQVLTKDIENLSSEEKIKLILNRYVSTLHRDLPEKGCILPALAAEIYQEKNRGGSRVNGGQSSGSNCGAKVETKKLNEIICQYLANWADLLAQHLPDEVERSEGADLNLSLKKQKALNLISQAVGAILLSRMVGETKLSDEIINSVRWQDAQIVKTIF